MNQTPPRQRLTDVAEFIPGQTVSQTCDDGNICLIRETDLFATSPPLYWARAAIPRQHFLQAGDIIFHPQYPRKSMVFNLPFTTFIACAPLIVCRIHQPETLLPAFVAWHLGSANVKAALYDAVRANASLHLPPHVFAALPLPMASMAVQTQIEQIWHEEQQREQSTLALFEQMRSNIDAVLMRYADIAGAAAS